MLTEVEDRTPRRTHIFLNRVGVPNVNGTFTRTSVWLKAQGSRHEWDVLHTCAHL